MTERGEEGFLSRWSRLKRQAAKGEPPEPPTAEPPEERAVPPAAAAGETDQEPMAGPATGEPARPGEVPPQPAAFDPASLPPVESLTKDSDISAFLKPEVPVALRSAALRRIWTLDPAIRDFVGLADYAWDYNAPDGVPGFSLDLGADAQKLLAQAIGLEEQPGPEARTAEAEGSHDQTPAAREENPPPEPALPPPSAPPLTDPEAAPDSAAGDAALVRRHGRARPA